MGQVDSSFLRTECQNFFIFDFSLFSSIISKDGKRDKTLPVNFVYYLTKYKYFFRRKLWTQVC